MAAIWIVVTGEDVGSSQVGLSDNLGDVGDVAFTWSFSPLCASFCGWFEGGGDIDGHMLLLGCLHSSRG